MADLRNSHTVGAALVAAAAVCWSTAGLVVRWAGAGPWETMFWRSVFLMVALLPILLLRRDKVVADCRAAGWAMAISGCLLAGCFIFFILALAQTSVANTLFVMACAPLLAAVIGRVFYHEMVRPKTWLAIAAAGVGVALMVCDSLRGGGLLGAALAFLVALCFSINANLVRHHRAVSLLPGVFLAGLISALIAAPFALPSLAGATELALFAYLGIIQLGLGLVLFTVGARSVTAAQSVLIGLLEVALGPLWVWFAFDERPTALALAGGSIVIAAVVVGTLGRRRVRASGNLQGASPPFPQ